MKIASRLTGLGRRLADVRVARLAEAARRLPPPPVPETREPAIDEPPR